MPYSLSAPRINALDRGGLRASSLFAIGALGDARRVLREGDECSRRPSPERILVWASRAADIGHRVIGGRVGLGRPLVLPLGG